MQHPNTLDTLTGRARWWAPTAWLRAVMLRSVVSAQDAGGRSSPASVHDAAEPCEREWVGPMEPKEFAEAILRDHEERRRAADGAWRWQDDPDWSGVVALAAMATRWDVDGPAFEAKLERLCRLPTGTARPAAERLLALWRAQQAAARN